MLKRLLGIFFSIILLSCTAFAEADLRQTGTPGVTLNGASTAYQVSYSSTPYESLGTVHVLGIIALVSEDEAHILSILLPEEGAVEGAVFHKQDLLGINEVPALALHAALNGILYQYLVGQNPEVFDSIDVEILKITPGESVRFYVKAVYTVGETPFVLEGLAETNWAAQSESSPAGSGLCGMCSGSGNCHLCNGSGKTYSYISSVGDNGWLQCSACHGSGVCPWCQGAGYGGVYAQ